MRKFSILLNIFKVMNKNFIFKFTVLAPIFTLIFGALVSENSPGFILQGIFALVASLSFGYFLYLYLTNSEELSFTYNEKFKIFINRSLKIGLSLFLLVTISFGQRFDYKSYVLQWDLVSRGLDPWGIDYIAEPSRNAYGPIHNLFYIFSDISPIIPKIVFVLLLIYSIYLITFCELKFKEDISILNKKSLFVLTCFSPMVVICGANYGVNDCWVTSLMLFSIYFQYSRNLKHKSLLSGIFIALAGMTKIYPFIFGIAFIIRKRRIDWEYLLSLVFSTFAIAYFSFLTWGMSSFTSFFFNSGRAGGGVSFMNYINQYFQNININNFNTAILVIIVLLNLIIIYAYKLDLLPSSIFMLASTLSVYKLGFSHFFLLFICIIPLVSRYLYSNKFTLSNKIIKSFIIWVSFLNFYQILYNSTGGMWNGDARYFRDQIAPLIFFVFTFNIFKKFLDSINSNAFRLNSLD